MKHDLLDPEERIFTFSDVRRLAKALRKKLCLIAFVCAALVFSVQLLRAPKYLAEATFKEGTEKNEEGGLKELLNGFGVSPQQPQAVVLMKSHQVLKPLVEKFGLQATVKRSGFLSKLLRRVSNNWKAERESPLPECDWFVFRNVQCNIEHKQTYSLRFTTPNTFEVLDKKTPIATGTVGIPVHFHDLSFTCLKTPSQLKLNRPYPLTISPWVDAVANLKQSLQITSHKTNKSIYDLSLTHPDRFASAQLLNGLMEEYQNYLKKEHETATATQLSYLEKRQAAIYQQMGVMFDEHAAYLKNALQGNGFIGLDEGMDNFLLKHEEMRGKILNIDMELAQLEQEQTSGISLAPTEFSKTLFATLESKRTLEQERNLLELALHDKLPPVPMETVFQELSAVRMQKQEVKQQLGSAELLSSFAWAKPFATRPEMKTYLNQQIRLLDLKEKMLQERFSHPSSSKSEFQGITLENARLLHTKYTDLLHEAEIATRRFDHLKHELENAGLELASLTSFLPDPFSQEIIKQASKTAHLLQDKTHQTEKDAERWSKELAFQKRVLSQHLEQLRSVEQLNADVTREKLIALQQTSLDCIHQQLSVAQEKCVELVAQRKCALHEEKQLLAKKMEELRDVAKDLPERWKLEHWLELKTVLGSKIMTAMTELVESKTISQHLHQVGSKPLDLAVVPFLPQKPGLFRLSLLSAFAATFLFFFGSLIRNILRGFPLSSEKLQALRYPFHGSLGDDVRETVRKVALFLEPKGVRKIAALLGGRGPNYSRDLAQTLSRCGHKVLLVECDFNTPCPEVNRPGLLQWLQNEVTEIPFRTNELFHRIPAGGFSPDTVELLRSKRFAELLSGLTQYDLVLLWVKTPLDSVEATAALSLVDQAVVTVSNEQTETLTPFIQWAYHEDMCRLTCVTA